jgi:hypothetical protein
VEAVKNSPKALMSAALRSDGSLFAIDQEGNVHTSEPPYSKWKTISSFRRSLHLMQADPSIVHNADSGDYLEIVMENGSPKELKIANVPGYFYAVHRDSNGAFLFITGSGIFRVPQPVQLRVEIEGSGEVLIEDRKRDMAFRAEKTMVFKNMSVQGDNLVFTAFPSFGYQLSDFSGDVNGTKTTISSALHKTDSVLKVKFRKIAR